MGSSPNGSRRCPPPPSRASRSRAMLISASPVACERLAHIKLRMGIVIIRAPCKLRFATSWMWHCLCRPFVVATALPLRSFGIRRRVSRGSCWPGRVSAERQLCERGLIHFRRGIERASHRWGVGMAQRHMSVCLGP